MSEEERSKEKAEIRDYEIGVMVALVRGKLITDHQSIRQVKNRRCTITRRLGRQRDMDSIRLSCDSRHHVFGFSVGLANQFHHVITVHPLLNLMQHTPENS